MANQWYYNSDDQQQGPISDTELRKMAADGTLGPEDLIWREGMSEWKKAGSLKGLFPKSSTPPSPPPLPTAQSTALEEQTGNNPQVSLGESAKLAGQLTAKQAELTKIQQVSLPGQYAKVGSQIFEIGTERSGHEELSAEIDRLNKVIADLEHASEKQPETTTFAEKAKALGGNAVTATKLKTAQVQRRQKLVALGKAVFESGKTPGECKSEKTQVENLLERISVLQSEISEIKERAAVIKGQVSERAGAAAAKGLSFLSSTAVVASLAVFCAPIGLFLIWRHPTWEKSTKLKWAGVSLASMLVFSILVKRQEAAALKELAAANVMWDDGNTADAIDEYRELIGNLSLPIAEQPRIYRRVIEFDCKNDDVESARTLIERALSRGIDLTLTDSSAKSLLADVKREREKAKVALNPKDASSGEAGESYSSKPEIVDAMALLVVALVSENQAWGSTTPEKFNQLMQTAARELADAGQSSALQYFDVQPTATKDVQSGTNQGTVVRYENVYCNFVRNPRSGQYALLQVEIDGKKYSMLGVGGG